jgi:hypothetical protein
MTARTLDGPPIPEGWLHSPAYDLGLIVGPLALALVLGAAAATGPEAFAWVLYFDLWLLAYPHVASTYTRVAFDRHSAREHWFLLTVLPPIMFAGTAGVALLGGAMALNSIYFYWQSWHYSRQSYGIARTYQRVAGQTGRDWLTDCVIYGFPVWGLLHRAHQRPAEFYGTPFWSPPVAHPWVVLAGAFALGALLLWTLRYLRSIREGAPQATGHALFVLSHVVITVVSYIVMRDVTSGWLFINIWHNAQYLLFVWAVNNRRFRGGVDPERPFLSRLCQREQLLRYALVCVGLSTAFYLALGLITMSITWQILPFVLVCHQAFNFHHYVVDSVIWRSRGRRAPVVAAPART